MASLLIIGGSGFFGKSILDSYKRGLLNFWNIDSISVLARNAQKLKIEFPELIDDSIKLINSDIATCNEVPFADYVIHAAASTDAANYISQPEIEKKNIQAATYNYCELAKKYHRNSRIIYCSSGAVYGQQPAEMEYISEEFEGGDVNEMQPLKRDYALAKRDAEKAIQELGRYKLKVSIARCFAFIGKYLPRNQHFAIGNFVEDCLRGRDIRINASNEVIRSYMYADDLVVWLLTIADSSNESVEIYNVGSEEAISIFELGTKMGNLYGVDAIYKSIISKKIDRYVPSVNKAKMKLGLEIRYNLIESVKETIKNAT
jgi:dTDP-glucose 4,6-dehydratase